MDIVLNKLIAIEHKMCVQQVKITEIKTLYLRQCKQQLDQLRAVQKAFRIMSNAFYIQCEDLSDMLGVMNLD